MIDAMSKAQRRMLALLILLVILAIGFGLTAAPLLSLNTRYLDDIDQLERRLQILQRKVAAGDELRARQTELKRMLATNRHYLPSKTEALAAADLQRMVKSIARTNGVEVPSTQSLLAVQELGFSGVTLKVKVRGKLENLARIIHTLESGRPFLFLDNLSIRSRVQHDRRINFKGGQHARTINLVETLDAEFEVTGYLLEQS